MTPVLYILNWLTNTVELLQVKSIHGERKSYQVPCVNVFVDRNLDEMVNVISEMPEHGYHIVEEVWTHRHLNTSEQ